MARIRATSGDFRIDYIPHGNGKWELEYSREQGFTCARTGETLKDDTCLGCEYLNHTQAYTAGNGCTKKPEVETSEQVFRFLASAVRGQGEGYDVVLV